MRKLLIASAALGVGLGSLVAASPSAALTESAACTADGHTLIGSADFVVQGAQHRWQVARGQIGGAGTGGKSNINFRLFADNVLRWAHNSPDNIKQNQLYQVPMTNVVTQRSSAEHMTLQGIFDTSFDDERCTASTRVF